MAELGRELMQPHERVLNTLRFLLRMIDDGESLDANRAVIRKGLENALSWEPWIVTAAHASGVESATQPPPIPTPQSPRLAGDIDDCGRRVI